MGYEEHDPAGGGEPLDLDAMVCPMCHEDLRPWEDECPDCRESGVLRFAVPGFLPPVPPHLLGDADTRSETGEPPDPFDGPPEPPPVSGDPHFG